MRYKVIRLSALSALSAAGLWSAPRIVELPGKSPLVTIRLVFTTGAASDPADKPGLAHLTAELLGGEGTKDRTYKRILDAMYPMATSISVYSDKEMTTFVGDTHVDNLDKFYTILRDMLLNPGTKTTYNGHVITYPDIKLVYWAGGNPFHHHQDLNRLMVAWQKPETIVFHEQFWTPAARMARPSATWRS